MNNYCGPNHLPYTLKIRGMGSISVEPNIADITLGVVTEDKELEAVQKNNSVITNNVISTLIGLGISKNDIKTVSYNISPQYESIDGELQLTGYKVSNNLRITIRDIANTGKIIDAAVNQGANAVTNINFTISDPSKYYKKALQRAIDDSKAKATTIAKNLNVYLFQIPIYIEEILNQPISPYTPTLLREAATPILPGEIEISSTIDAVFSYRPR